MISNFVSMTSMISNSLLFHFSSSLFKVGSRVRNKISSLFFPVQQQELYPVQGGEPRQEGRIGEGREEEGGGREGTGGSATFSTVAAAS